MAGTWAWIGRRREEEILRLELSHIDHIHDVAKHSLELVKAFMEKSTEELVDYYEKVSKAENKADEVKEGILKDLSEGVFHPIDREELLRLVLVADDIAAHLKAASRRLLLFSKTSSKKPSKQILSGMEQIAELAVRAVEKIKEGIEAVRKNPRHAVELAREIERLEEQADDIRSEVEEKILEWCNKEGETGSCIALYNALESLETATDKCEDTADVIRSIAILNL